MVGLNKFYKAASAPDTPAAPLRTHAAASTRTPTPTSRGDRAAPFPAHARAHAGAVSQSTPALFPVHVARAPPLPHICTRVQ